MDIWKFLEVFLYVRMTEEKYYQDLMGVGQDVIAGPVQNRG